MRSLLPFVLLLATGCPKSPGDTAEHVTFTVLALPDTQEYADRYPEIFEANKPMLKDPDLIYPGQVLRIPQAPNA